jgi:hypothetical protein|uniref:Uncharacterized protein n=2 Tax=Picea TaxID=3328 RepID=A0A6B9XS34_PICSI|nr:hypothetical protein Q903MT_gene6800 [Picea sitchensis]
MGETTIGSASPAPVPGEYETTRSAIRILSGMMTIALHLELLLLIELEGMLGEVVVVGKLELGEAMNLEMELAKMLAPKLVALDLDPLLLALESDLPHMDLALWDQLDFEWARSLGIS